MRTLKREAPEVLETIKEIRLPQVSVKTTSLLRDLVRKTKRQKVIHLTEEEVKDLLQVVHVVDSKKMVLQTETGHQQDLNEVAALRQARVVDQEPVDLRKKKARRKEAAGHQQEQEEAKDLHQDHVVELEELVALKKRVTKVHPIKENLLSAMGNLDTSRLLDPRYLPEDCGGKPVTATPVNPFPVVTDM